MSSERDKSNPLSIAFIFFALPFLGCVGGGDNEVVVYAALDREFSEPILNDFEDQTGIKPLPKYDQESNKTVGLANEIIQQAARQRCDVFWNNEILHSLRLEQKGLLEVYRSPLADDYPESFISKNKTWHGFAARARVLIVNTHLMPDQESRPTSILDLANDQWKNNCGIAKPLFGTTATHAAVLFANWGDEKADEFFSKVANNAIVEGGNKQVAVNVARGRYAFGITDTDDAIIELEKGAPVEIVFPDQGEDGTGTLFIPNTLCVIKGGPNPERARQLVDFLLSTDVETKLAKGQSAQIPLNRNTQERSRVEAENIKFMKVDFEKAAREWDRVSTRIAELFR